MRAPSQLRSGEFGFNMTPMIDVVFLLIIFFLVSSHLAKREAQLQLPLPEASAGEQPVDDDAARLTINVLEDGGVMIAGRVVTPTELPERLGERLLKSGPDLEVRIRSDRHTPYREVQKVMLACAQSKLWNVKFAVIKKGTGR
ncbi:biopolymer transport protein ExbD [Lignipirellula cremea]|uniref:Biopolymer transport protein ExbD n=2 Tax=Lignipirellula cremea TaxID=2528010 RepID=A0A518E2I4_9BACT|nr:biopolymer transport protein ExbD [Lignipirellula cremea]